MFQFGDKIGHRRASRGISLVPFAIAWAFGLACVLAVWGGRQAVADEPLPPAAEWMPGETVVAVEVLKPKAIWDWVLDPHLTTAITTNPMYQHELSVNPGLAQAYKLVDYLAGRLGTDWQTALRKLTGGGITLAVGGKGGMILAIDAEDPAMLKQLNEMLVAFAQNQGADDKVKSDDYQGVKVWNFGPSEAHAIVGNRLIVSNKADALRQVLDGRNKTGSGTLAAAPFYAAARKALGDRAVLAVVNMQALKGTPKLEKAFSELHNPLGTLLFAGLLDGARKSDWVAVGLQASSEGLGLRAVTSAQADATGLMSFGVPGPNQGALANLAAPRQLAGVSLFRDLHKFYATKDKLFPERTSGLIFFENMMGIFFSGRDLTEEVLAEARPEVRLVVAQQRYEAGASTPTVQLPGAALVFKVQHPERFGEIMEEAWQKMLGLVNFTRGQKALPGLIIDRPTHSDVRYSMAYFGKGANDDTEHLALRHNLRPSLVRMDDYIILSTTATLAEDLIDAIKGKKDAESRPLPGVSSLVEIDGARVMGILDANRTALIHNNMLEKGNSLEKAEAEINVFLGLIKRLQAVRLEMANRDGHTQADLEVKLNLGP